MSIFSNRSFLSIKRCMWPSDLDLDIWPPFRFFFYICPSFRVVNIGIPFLTCIYFVTWPWLVPIYLTHDLDISSKELTLAWATILGCNFISQTKDHDSEGKILPHPWNDILSQKLVVLDARWPQTFKLNSSSKVYDEVKFFLPECRLCNDRVNITRWQGHACVLSVTLMMIVCDLHVILWCVTCVADYAWWSQWNRKHSEESVNWTNDHRRLWHFVGCEPDFC
jgi:hypothetical protein